MSEDIKIREINLQKFTKEDVPMERSPNINMLKDVKMLLKVELGRTEISIRDILQLGEGSIVELNKLAGESVDIFINNKSVAKGEVVVIDENFGVRVTEIINPSDRM